MLKFAGIRYHRNPSGRSADRLTRTVRGHAPQRECFAPPQGGAARPSEKVLREGRRFTLSDSHLIFLRFEYLRCPLLRTTLANPTILKQIVISTSFYISLNYSSFDLGLLNCPRVRYNRDSSGRSADRLARTVRVREVGGSNPLAPTRDCRLGSLFYLTSLYPFL